MTLLELQQKANPVLANIWSVIQTRQASYFANHGKYFQLLVTPDTEVVGGADSPFTIRHPSDAQFIVDIDVPWASTIPFQISVDTTDGPDGHGYSATVTAKVGVKIYQRTRDHTNADTGWSEIIPLAI